MRPISPPMLRPSRGQMSSPGGRTRLCPGPAASCVSSAAAPGLFSLFGHCIWQHNVSSLSCLHISKQPSSGKLTSAARGHRVSKQTGQEAARAREHSCLLTDAEQGRAPERDGQEFRRPWAKVEASLPGHPCSPETVGFVCA